MIEAKTLCQSCIERGLQPNEAIGLWQDMPICDDCLKPLIENRNEGIQPAENQVEIEVKNAIEFVEELEKLFEKFPIASEQVLRSHDDFYNHRALANINIPVQELDKIIDQRKSIIFALNRRNEPDVLRLQQIKREERERAGIVGVEKSKREVNKNPSNIKRAQLEKIAKQLGISLEEMQNWGQEARQKLFAGVLRNEKQDAKPKGETESTRDILETVKGNVQSRGLLGNVAEAHKPTQSTVTGTGRCPTCRKFTCVC